MSHAHIRPTPSDNVQRGVELLQHNETLVRRIVEEIWNQGELDLADSLFAPAYVNHGGIICDLVLGPEAIKISVALLRTAFPNLHVTVEDISTTDDTVALRWTACNATCDDVLPQVSRGNPRGLEGTTHVRFARGMIAESWTYWDRVNVLGRLGFMHPHQTLPTLLQIFN